ncbi:hypothetical protein VCRA2116O28_100006 [Vibrio crassostreae]|nr:hypothetical protein VCRA2116O28_100006 [Vibrio crassostreae]CAK1691816.1 hypothetical protein VCRA2116O27_100006 [Vibrio crassostreae]CAK1725406.1 hypothetical protein VCRA2119O46_110152 [Vibrio crassostreae]CAK1729894.1 hypothetical protein VCRA2117O40_120006 [Vibrio crassostreae]CAK2342172.1 hypothetical protein VCRA2117O143_330006 [Vibrio crassostreae]
MFLFESVFALTYKEFQQRADMIVANKQDSEEPTLAHPRKE